MRSTDLIGLFTQTALGGNGKDDGPDRIRRLLRAVAALETQGDESQAASFCARRSQGQQCEMVNSAASRRSAKGTWSQCRGLDRGRQRWPATCPRSIWSPNRCSLPPGPSDLGDSEDRGARSEGLTGLLAHRRNGTALGRWLQHEVSFGGCTFAPIHQSQMRTYAKRKTTSCFDCLRSSRTKQAIRVSGAIRFAHVRTGEASTG